MTLQEYWRLMLQGSSGSSRDDTRRNVSTNPGAAGSTRSLLGTAQTPTTVNANGRVASRSATAAGLTPAQIKPLGLAQGYSVNSKINWNDKGSDDKAMSHLETFDEQLSKLAGRLTLAKRWKPPTLLRNTSHKADPRDTRGGASHGDRQGSQSDRNSSNYGGAGPGGRR